MIMKTKKVIEERLALTKDRLKLYLAKEKEILDGGVRAYGIGSRNLERYNADLDAVRKAIDELYDDIAELEAQLDGTGGARKAVAVIPRDW